jgi:sugar/nucleoside kinase (ribokinase family)
MPDVRPVIDRPVVDRPVVDRRVVDRRGVLCIGTLVVDVAKVVDSYPELDRLAVIESVGLSTGGPALNLAMDLALIGADYPLAVAGRVGVDAHADLIRDSLQRNRVDVTGIVGDRSTATSFTDAMIVRDGGRRTFFHHIGANGLLTADAVDLASSSASTARILHLGAPGLHPGMDDAVDPPTDHAEGRGNGWSQVLAAARAAGLRTNLELVTLPAPRLRQLVLPCLPHLDSLVVNDLEACALAGVTPPATGPEDTIDWPLLESVASALVKAGVHQVVAVHFPGGAVAADPLGNRWRQGSVRLPRQQIRNATGAGDAFASGVVHGLHEGWTVADSLRAGVAVAAASLRGGGTSDGVLPLADCLQLGERYGYRPS